MNRWLRYSYLGLIFAFFYLPIAALVVFSFNQSTYSQLWHGFTWHWYHVLFQDTRLLIVTGHSLIVAVSAATVASALGLLAAYLLFRFRFFGKRLIYGLIFSLIVLPDIVMGIALMLLFSYSHIRLGFSTVLLAHITFCFPFVAVVVLGRLSGLNPALFEVAQDCGASEWQILRFVVLPQLWTAVLAGWLLSFTLSFDDVLISYFVTGPSFQTLPLEIFSLVRLGIKPEINALCSLVLLLTLSLVISAQFLMRPRVRTCE